MTSDNRNSAIEIAEKLEILLKFAEETQNTELAKAIGKIEGTVDEKYYSEFLKTREVS